MKSIYNFTLSCLILNLFISGINAQYSALRFIEEGTDQDFEFIEDINNDGVLDAVLNGGLECSGGEYFRIYHGVIDELSGNYYFELVHTNFLDQGFFMYLMDMNGDGHKEVVSQALGNGTITIARFENGEYNDYIIEDEDIDLTFVLDIDNDGIDENIRRASNTFYRGNFDEDFNYTESIFLTKETNSLSLYDYDKDGIQDYLYFDNDSLHILLIDGGLKDELVVYDNDLPFVFADERLFYDVDQNGDVDYLYRPSNFGGLSELFIAWNIEQNGFSQIETIAQTISLENFETFHYIDLDFDGDEDMVIKDFSAPGEFVYRDAKTGKEVQIEYLDEFDTFDHFSTEGNSQIIVASDYSNEVQEPLAVIKYELESDVFVGEELAVIIPDYSSIRGAVKTDLDQNGTLDLLYTAYSSAEYGENRTVRWISDIDGPGLAYSNRILGHLEDIENSIFVDIDADGDTDIVSAKNLTVYYNNGLANFSNSKELEIGVENKSKLEFADLDGDGLLDLVVLRRNGDLVVYKNIDGEEFEPTILGVFNELSELELLHIDKDQNIDIVVLRSTSIFTLMNNGDGSFSDSHLSSVSSTTPLFFNDINKDGDVEYIYENFGQVAFIDFNEEYVLDPSSLTVLFEGENFKSYHLFDVDKDGDQDILTSENSNDKVQWYEVAKADSVVSRGALNSFLLMPDEPYFFNDPYLTDFDQFVVGDCGKLYITEPEAESIEICVYLDANSDGELDAVDYTVANFPFSIVSGSINSVLTTNESGCINVRLHSGTFQFRSLEEGCYSILDEIAVSQNLDVINLLATNNGTDGGVKVDLTSSPTRCGFMVEHWLTVRNESCNSELGTVEVELDDIALWNTISSDEMFFQFEKFLTFDVTDLRPGESKIFQWTMEIPDFTNTGEYLDHEVKVLDKNSTELANFDYRSEIRCAYDPNDKSISPDRAIDLGESFITDEALSYLIRFQNVGNDTAFNIVVRDTLSPNLDLRSLQNIRTSHNSSYSLDSLTRILQFDFDDIMLVDSLTNERDSHGFIKFDILPVDDLDDYEPIFNNAGIYFDFNPPVITNTVEAKYVHDLSILTATEDIDLLDRIDVHPNPAFQFINIAGLPDGEVLVELLTISGQKVYSVVSQKNFELTIDISDLEKGFYLLKVFDGAITKVEKIVIQ